MLAAALEDEVAAYVAAFAGERDEQGRRLVVRNGHARARQVTTAAGAVEVRAPRVDDRRGGGGARGRGRLPPSVPPPGGRQSPEGAGGGPPPDPPRASAHGLSPAPEGGLRS